MMYVLTKVTNGDILGYFSTPEKAYEEAVKIAPYYARKWGNGAGESGRRFDFRIKEFELDGDNKPVREGCYEIELGDKS